VTVAADLARDTPFATFRDATRQRNNVKVWHEYECYWNAHEIVEPAPR
jgi:hypothetical protein